MNHNHTTFTAPEKNPLKKLFCRLSYIFRRLSYRGLSVSYFALVLASLTLLGMAIIQDINIRDARYQFESKLSSSGWKSISVFNNDFNSAEILARKRSDAEFGVNNYDFESTNSVSKFWFKVTSKK